MTNSKMQLKTPLRGVIIVAMTLILSLGLSACNSTDSNVSPLENLGNETQTAENGINTPTELNPSAPVSQSQLASNAPQIATTRKIYIPPIIGAPNNAVTPLSRRLAIEARNLSIGIEPTSPQLAEATLKGYLSAYKDGQTINVVYVWDILDGTGQRQYRIQGQKNAPVSNQAASQTSQLTNQNNPWANVSSTIMEQIAVDTIAQYNAWRTSTPR